jgi:hypothetical protein
MLRKRTVWLVAGIVLLLAGLFAGLGAGSSYAQPRTVWAVVQGASPTAALQDVYMLDTHTAYVVGGDGDVGVAYRLVWTGSKWEVSEYQQFRAWLKAVVAVSDDNVWAVGDAGLVAHRDGRGWSEVGGVSSLAYMTTIQMLGNGEEGWAGGTLRYSTKGPNGDPMMLHYRNGQWLRDTSVNFSGGINSLHFAPGGGWAVGADIWHYQSGAWTKERPPAPCGSARCTDVFYAVRAINSQEAWFFGFRQEQCDKCQAQPFALHKVGNSWQRSLPDGVTNWKAEDKFSYNLKGATFYGTNFGLAVGVAREPAAHPLMFSYKNGKWTRDNVPAAVGDLNKVSLRDESHAMAVGYNGLILSWGYGSGQPAPTPTPIPPTPTPAPGTTPQPTPDPVQRVPDPHQVGVIYFPIVGHTLRGQFADYWQFNGGLEQFGYPLTEQYIDVSPTNGRAYVVQYFERARFEAHPENQPPFNVLLGLLGRTITAGREREAPFLRTQQQPLQGYLYFEATGHNIPVQFSSYWQQHGGLPVYGYPISEAFQEVSPTDGRPYLVQYFERNRLEYHPELPEPFRVSLGLLGAQVLRSRGWIR